MYQLKQTKWIFN